MGAFDVQKNLYSLDKTICFDLLPLSDVSAIAEESILRDEERHKLSTNMKDLMDSFHKTFINQVLNRLSLFVDQKENKDEYGRNKKIRELFVNLCLLLTKRNLMEEEKDEIESIQTELRSIISKAFVNNNLYKGLFNKDVISHLKNYVHEDEEQLNMIEKFDGFVGYFDSFFTNRKNIYTSSAIATAIPFRIVNQNLPKFVDNIKAFEKLLKSPVASCIDTLYKDYEEILNVASLQELFCADNYINCLCQHDIDAYNYVIGGMEKDGESKLIKGLNQYIKEYNDTCLKSERLPLFVPLFKQILTDRVKVSWLKDEFSSDAMLLEAIYKCHNNIASSVCNLKEMLTKLDDYDANGIYIRNDESLSLISQRLYGRYSVISDAVQKIWQNNNVRKARETEEKYLQRSKDAFKKEKQFSLAYLAQCLGSSMTPYFTSLGEVIEDGEIVRKSYFAQISEAYKGVAGFLDERNNEGIELVNDNDSVARIKLYLDSLKSLQRFITPLVQENVATDTDAEFYNQFDAIVETLNQVTDLYNKVRNRLTRRPYNEDKFQLFFDNNSKMLGGWSDSKTEKSDNGTQYGGYIFRKLNEIGEYDYFLGISADTKLFRSFNKVDEEEQSSYERLNYYQLGAKTFFGGCYNTAVGHAFSDDKDKLCSYFTAYSLEHGNSALITAITRENLKSESQRKTATPRSFLSLISKMDGNCYRALVADNRFLEISTRVTANIQQTMATVQIASMKKCATKMYSSFVEAMDDAELCCKSDKVFEYFHVNEHEMIDAMSRGTKRLYMFKISNKDLSYASKKDIRKSRGRDNLHTMYFKALMDGGHSIFDIGTASVYFRRKTEGLKKEYATHPKNKPICNKNPKTVVKKATSTFSYDIQKDARYTKDSFKLHLSMRMNYAKGKVDEKGLNNKVLQSIREGRIRHIIGIDRGERHLLYLTIIDTKGNLVCQKSLNVISNEYNETNYQQLLSVRMIERDQGRKSWKHIDNIKNLKEGYLSQVVHEIASMIVEYDAIVVLENLNTGFMRGRQKIEKQVYQKFEKALIDKLNFYVNKSYDVNSAGGLYNPLQLTYPYKNNASADGQNGVLFYIPAWNTSKMDPVTGFVSMLHLKYESVKSSVAELEKMDSITYNRDKSYYEFSVDYSRFTNKTAETRTNWTICSYGSRIEQKRDIAANGNWVGDDVESLTEEFDAVFSKFGISKDNNIKEQILCVNKPDFFKEFYRIFNLMMQMRNSKPNSEIDYLLSPVADENGQFYDSRVCSDSLPKDADANGAYNIARKGLWAIRKIKDTAEGERLNLAISNKEWLQFAQQKPYLND